MIKEKIQRMEEAKKCSTEIEKGVYKILKAFDLSYESVVDLNKTAIAASKGCYAPYSNISVGAAIIARKNAESPYEVLTGANIENASYRGTFCAESCCIAHARASGYTG